MWKSTPLSIAMLKRNLVCVNQLIEKAGTIDANVKDDNGNTLLSIAIESMNEQNFDMIKKLLKGSGKKSNKDPVQQGADPNIPDADGNTPLIKVIQRIVKNRKDKKPFKLELKVAKLLLKNNADPGIKNKIGQSAITMVMQTNSYSNTMSKADGLSELVQLLWKGFSFVNSPESFFSFNKSILSPDTQAMIITFIEKSLEEIKKTPEFEEDGDAKMEDEEEEQIDTGEKENELPYKIINTLDKEGYTPFLRYISEFSIEGRRILQRIENEIRRLNINQEADLSKVDMSSVMKDKQSNNNVFGGGNYANQNNNGGLFGNQNNNNGGLFGNQNYNNGGLFSNQNNNGGGIFGNQYNNAGNMNNQVNTQQKKLALKLFDDNITKPFTDFLKSLISFGANQHATVDKLEDYREVLDQNGLKIRRRDSHGKVSTEY